MNEEIWSAITFGENPIFSPTRKVEVLVSTVVVGDGTKKNPYRMIGYVGTLDGEFIAIRDDWADRNKKCQTGTISVNLKTQR